MHYVINLEVVGSNLTHTWVCRMLARDGNNLLYVPDITRAQAKQINQLNPISFNAISYLENKL